MIPLMTWPAAGIAASRRSSAAHAPAECTGWNRRARAAEPISASDGCEPRKDLGRPFELEPLAAPPTPETALIRLEYARDRVIHADVRGLGRAYPSGHFTPRSVIANSSYGLAGRVGTGSPAPGSSTAIYFPRILFSCMSMRR